MKCPLMVEKLQQEGIYTIPQRLDCLEQECAWWDGVHGKCAVPVLTTALSATFTVLEDIRDKFPPARG